MSKNKMNNIKIMNNEETIKCIQKGMSICRFGDGEFNIILGGRTRLQPENEELVEKMKKILKDNSPNVLIGIPEAFDKKYDRYTKDASDFWKKYNEKNYEKILSLLDQSKQYYSSQITWFYIDYKEKDKCDKYVEELKKIWKDRKLLIVEGMQTRMGIGNDLFNGAKSIKRILCPAENAYSKYNYILESCLKCSKDYLILIALGATATVLAYDLAKNGFQALDFGHVDLEYEWYIRKAHKKIKIENKFNKEINDCEVTNTMHDKEYKNSIITIIN